MTRKYSDEVDTKTVQLLDTIASSATPVAAYQQAMEQLGGALAERLLRSGLDANKYYCIVSTVEDADFLAKGILDSLVQHVRGVSLACYWNHRFKPFDDGPSVAPIKRRFLGPGVNAARELIVVKSIINNACVVKTNITDLIEKIKPEKIWVVAPVIFEKAEENLKAEFPEEIYSRFKFLYLAADSEQDAKGLVIPGIGGDVYQRLGFNDQDEKNTFIPRIVKELGEQLLRQKSIA